MTEDRLRVVLAAAALVCSTAIEGATVRAPRIQVIPHAVAPRVDVLVDGKPFTSYVYLRALPRPALDPVRTASGGVVTRDVPYPDAVEPQHQLEGVGLWFAHGDVNGVDFAGARERPGTIVHRRVIEAISGDEEGQLGVESAWLGPGGSLVLIEDARFIFRDREHRRTIDRITRLTAVRGPVRLGRNPRGVLGIRLAPGVLTEGAMVTGPEGPVAPSSVASTRRRWVAVSGALGSDAITVALMDHPGNPGFPAAWRLDESGTLQILPTGNVDIEGDRSVRYGHRLAIFSGRVDSAAIDAEFRSFASGEHGGR